MAIRVTQQNMYNTMVGRMQKNLGNYMESVEQGSTQKKINRPSDDPAGTYRVLTTRVDMTSNTQYMENVDTARGWLNLADDVLSSRVSTAITGLKTLAEQASTGTYDASQRAIMAEQARQYFGQLLNLSNTDFEGKSIFAGHKYDSTAFEEGLAMTSWDNELLSEELKKDNPAAYEEKLEKTFNYLVSQGQANVVGTSSKSIMVQFTGGQADPDDPDADTGNPLAKGTTYRWSNDGGETWNEGEVEDSEDGTKFILKLDPNGAYIELNKKRLDADGKELLFRTETDPQGNEIPSRDANGKLIPDPNGKPVDNDWSVIPCVEDSGPGARNGTTLYIRPGAFYQGDDKDPPVDVTLMGTNLKPGDVKANGEFGKNVLVRVDGQYNQLTGEYSAVDMTEAGTEFFWSYSTDGGATWVTAKGITPQPPADADGNAKTPSVRLPIPGGYVEFEGDFIRAGSQAMIHPSRADLGYEIMKDTYLSVNGVGKDIFGGYYEGKPSLEGDDNLFEVVGAFIGYLEFNNQEGCQRTLAALEVAQKQILHEATRVGGMENRVEMANDVLTAEKIDRQERLSYIEDIDLTELLTKLTRQQLTYQTVLQSSSMIMQMSLANYV